MKECSDDGDRCVYFHMPADSIGPPFYVGMGTTKRAFSKGSRNADWKKTVAKMGGKFKVVFFDSGLTIDQAAKIEKMCIEFFGIENLTNKSLGGEHSAYGMRHTEKTKHRIATLNKQYNNQPHVKEALRERMLSSNPMRGCKHTEQSKKKMRDNHKTGKEVYTFVYDNEFEVILTRSAFRAITHASLEDAQDVILRRLEFKGWRRHDA